MVVELLAIFHYLKVTKTCPGPGPMLPEVGRYWQLKCPNTTILHGSYLPSMFCNFCKILIKNDATNRLSIFDLIHKAKACINKRSCGAMDNASAYGAEDCRFDPCQDRFFSLIIIIKNNYNIFSMPFNLTLLVASFCLQPITFVSKTKGSKSKFCVCYLLSLEHDVAQGKARFFSFFFNTKR